MNVLRRSIFKSTPFSHSLFKPHRISKLFSLPFSTNNKKDQEIKKNNILTTNKIPWWKPITDELNTVPNMITCSRMVATPFLGYVILQEEYTMACAGLAVFGFSDWLDGYIARTYNQTSVLGTFLDPFADKILIMTLVAVEGWGGLLPMPLVGLILARDAGLIVGGFYIRGTTKPDDVPFFDTTQASALEVTPSMLSKFNTACQVGLLMSALTNAAWGYPGNDMVLGLCWLTGATTFGSGVDYFINRPIANVAGTTTTTESTTPGPPLSMKQKATEELVQQGVLLLEKEGSAAFETLRKNPSEWYHDDTYLFIYDSESNVIFNSAAPEKEGHNVLGLEDLNGKKFHDDLIAIGITSEKECGWVDYVWPKPGDVEPTQKWTYSMKVQVDGKDCVLMSGFYS